LSSSLDDLLEDIHNAGEGRETVAFFDFDKTLIAGYSAQSFLTEQLLGGQMSPTELRAQATAIAKYSTGRLNFSGLVAETAHAMRGQAEYVFEEFGERVYQKKVAGAIYPEARALVEAHREMGHTLAIVSSATKYQIEPAAREFGIEYILCTELELQDGVFTGDVVSPTCFGDGKRLYAEELSDELETDMGQSFFYTDSDDDMPLLDAVGFPRTVNPNRKLARVARMRDWPICNFDSRDRPTLAQIARTGSIFTMLPTALALTTPLWALTGDKRQALNLAGTIWSDVASALAGLTYDITGEEHLWSDRPAVFIFNHQSSVDPVIVGKLLQRDFTGVGKKEIEQFPLVGPALKYADMVFIDRASTEKAIDAMKPVIKAINDDGLSVVLAPEGTRSHGKRLSKFKKGAFHIAMQAGVPIVPIIIHNAADSLPRGQNIARPAEIKVTVLPPVSTEKWTVKNLDKKVADIRQQYLDALGQEDDD